MQSDASFLTRSEARSVAGGFSYLSNKNDLTFINGPISCHSSIIGTVVSSVAEAEYAALFINAKTYGTWFRQVLSVMGYPQLDATPIVCDNSVAVGISNLSLKPKHSKAIDMRYHFVRDQVAQGKFRVYWQAGATNLADFFTKPLPVHKFQEMKHYFVKLPPNPTNPSLNYRARANHIRRFHMLNNPNKFITH
jgi:hypothetical protein